MLGRQSNKKLQAHQSASYSSLIDACPNATLVANWFFCERVQLERLDVSPLRWRWVGDGEAFDAGDRTMLAVRPPLYDSPTTRGLFDTSTGVYWASDCYATPVPQGTAFVDQLDPDEWAEGFNTFQHWNSPWVTLADGDRFAQQCQRIEALQPTTIARTHGPTIAAPDLPRAFELLRSVPTTPAPPQPGQPVLDEIVATMTRPARRRQRSADVRVDTRRWLWARPPGPAVPGHRRDWCLMTSGHPMPQHRTRPPRRQRQQREEEG